MNIIGISGFAGSGKDTVADMMVNQHPHSYSQSGVIKISLADPIKRFARDVWGFTDDQLWGSSEHRNAPDKRYMIGKILDQDEYIESYLTPRKVLQHVGTEGCRAIDPDVWIRYMIRVAKTLLTEYGYTYSPQQGLIFQDASFKAKAVVTADVRFLNEMQHIRGAGGVLVRVVRPGAGLEGAYAKHQSEAEMAAVPDKEFDKVIQNTGTLNDLKKTVNILVASLPAQD